jgi:protoheme ferro-lyase
MNQHWAGFMKDTAQKQSSHLMHLIGDDLEDQRATMKSVSEEAIAQMKNPETMLTSVVSMPLFVIKLQTLWFQQALESMISIQQKMGLETKQAVHHWQEQNSRLLKHAVYPQASLLGHETSAKGSKRQNGAVHHRGFPR